METTWHILRVKTLFESKVAGDLLVGLGLKSYVPIERRKIVRRSKSIEVPRPLMPGYVFVGARHELPWRDIAEIKHYVRWLRDSEARLISVSDAEVARVRLMERQYNQQLADRRSFKVGDRVAPSRGPFASMTSLLRELRGSTATIEVQMLGSVRDVTIPVSQLEKVA